MLSTRIKWWVRCPIFTWVLCFPWKNNSDDKFYACSKPGAAAERAVSGDSPWRGRQAGKAEARGAGLSAGCRSPEAGQLSEGRRQALCTGWWWTWGGGWRGCAAQLILVQTLFWDLWEAIHGLQAEEWRFQISKWKLDWVRQGREALAGITPNLKFRPACRGRI